MWMPSAPPAGLPRASSSCAFKEEGDQVISLALTEREEQADENEQSPVNQE